MTMEHSRALPEAASQHLPPLAVRMRPTVLEEVLGQDHLLAQNAPLRRLVESRAPLSVILYGPPGTGKTTLALLLSASTSRAFVEVSAVSGTVKDLRTAIEAARALLEVEGTGTVLFVDEVHRFSKAQQDTLLPAVENNWVSLVAATTENPSFSVISPLLSRSLLATLRPLSDEDLLLLLQRAVADERGLAGTVTVEPEAASALVALSGGDARRLLTLLEAAAGGVELVSLARVEEVADRALVRYDRDGDQHYDVTSAFIKSLRGSDPDAALHYLARMLEAGEDPRFIARRLMIHASEDVGIADPSALTAAVNASHVLERVGLPEARLALAQATIHIALAPKSNAVLRAINEAQADVRAGRIGLVPPHLRDAHYPGAKKLGHGRGYVYPHEVEGFVASQQHLPDELVGRQYYQPVDSGLERQASERLKWLRARLRRR